MIKKVKILGKQYKIKFVPPGDDHLHNGNYGGKVHMYSNIIYIANDLNDQMKMEILLHEIIHVLDFALTLKLEEDGVKRLGEGMIALIVDNPKLLELKI